MPPILRYNISNLLKKIPTQFVEHFLTKIYGLSKFSGIGNKFEKISEIIKENDEIFYYKNLISVNNNPANFLLSGEEPETLLSNSNLWPKTECFQELMMLLDITTYLQDDILVKIDRGAMFTSLETRVPFLDHKLIEWTLGLPKELKFSKTKSKVALRKVLHKYIPQELIERPKMGFGIPIDIWLKSDLRDWAEEIGRAHV